MNKKITKNDKVVRILHYIPAFKYGGIESFILDLYRNIDRNKFQFDFIIETNMEKTIKNEILNLGGKVYEIPSIKNISKHVKSINSIFKDNQYLVIHCHSIQTRPILPILARKNKIPIRIVHSHSVQFNDNSHLLLKKIVQSISVKMCNCFMACSKEAATFLFNNNKNVFILNNGIDLKRFKYNEKKRYEIRNNLKIKNNEKILIQIGRMTYLKNQQLSIKIIDNMADNLNYKLILIGSGPDEEKIKQKIQKSHLKSKILLLGYKENIEDYLSASDVFLFPSISEGLGISLIEAQANGIPCVCSNNIPKQVIKNANVRSLEIDNSVEMWISDIIKISNKRIFDNQMSILSDFDISNVAKNYEKYIIKELNLWKQKQ